MAVEGFQWPWPRASRAVCCAWSISSSSKLQNLTTLTTKWDKNVTKEVKANNMKQPTVSLANNYSNKSGELWIEHLKGVNTRCFFPQHLLIQASTATVPLSLLLPTCLVWPATFLCVDTGSVENSVTDISEIWMFCSSNLQKGRRKPPASFQTSSN